MRGFLLTFVLSLGACAKGGSDPALTPGPDQGVASLDLSAAPVDGGDDLAGPPDLAATDQAPELDRTLLLEPLDNPRLRFADGTVVNNAPGLFPGAPAIAGFSPSAWYVAQWKKTELMRPDVMYENSQFTIDPVLGASRWAFPTTDNQSHVWIWEPAGGPRVFELYGEHGWLDAAGGSNVFLSVDAIAESETAMDRSVHLTMRAKIARSSVTYTAQGADADGSVLWQAFTGLIFQYLHPGGGRTTLFLQVRHGDARDAMGTYLSASGAAPGAALIWGGRLPSTPSLQGDRPMGALVPLDVDLNAYLCDAISRSFPVAGGGSFTFGADAKDLSGWRFKSLYTGIETQDRLGSATATPRGSDLVAFQVAAVDVRKAPASSPTLRCP